MKLKNLFQVPYIKRQNIALLSIIVSFMLYSCINDPTENSGDVNQKEHNFLVSDSAKIRKFSYNSDSIKMDTLANRLLEGEWVNLDTTNNIAFLLAGENLAKSKKVIFKNHLLKEMTGWGEITYNRSAKYYIDENTGVIFEYYVNKINKLILIKFNYRDENLDFTSNVHSTIYECDYTISKTKLCIIYKGQTFFLQKRIY